MNNFTFVTERFLTGVVSKQGKRSKNEDTYIVCHDLGLDLNLKASFYAVIDGHGGIWCS